MNEILFVVGVNIQFPSATLKHYGFAKLLPQVSLDLGVFTAFQGEALVFGLSSR